MAIVGPRDMPRKTPWPRFRKGSSGVDFVEIEVRRTADGVLVVLHDETVNRTTNGKGRVDRLSLQEVKKFSAVNGENIPTLEEVRKVVGGEAGPMLELVTGTVCRIDKYEQARSVECIDDVVLRIAVA